MKQRIKLICGKPRKPRNRPKITELFDFQQRYQRNLVQERNVFLTNGAGGTGYTYGGKMNFSSSHTAYIENNSKYKS